MAIGRAVAFEPLQVGHTVVTKAPQRGIRDHALGLVLQVVEHRLGAVIETGRLLVASPATGIDHPAALGTGTAAGKTVGHQHIGAAGPGFEGRTGPRRPPAQHQHIAVLLPLQRVAVGDPQRFENLGAGTVPASLGTHALAPRWLAR